MRPVVLLTFVTSMILTCPCIGCDNGSDPNPSSALSGGNGADANLGVGSPDGTAGPLGGAGGVVSTGGIGATVDSGTTGGVSTTGGVVATGGVATGGVGPAFDSGTLDGTVATGGVDATGGNPASGGSGATVGSDPVPSLGCGAQSPLSGNFTIDVQGTNREYIVTVPDNYDSNTPYRLIFAWHGLGGTAEQIASGFFRGGYYGLESRAGGSAIFVAGQGLETSNAVGSGPGWDNSGGRDVAFTTAMLDWMRSNYCIDETRIFSVGMSYGGIMSNTVGCSLGEDFRAIAPMSGMGPMVFGGASCVGQVAAWISHGNTDTIVPFDSGQASRDHWVTANHCDTTTTATGGNGCVAYNGCDDGYPVIWCEFDGGHTTPSFAGDEIWAFFSQF